MTEIIYDYYVNFGRGDSSDYVEAYAELNDEEEEAYKRSILLRTPFDEFEPLADTVTRIQAEAEEIARDEYEDGYYDSEFDEDDIDDPWDSWTVTVVFRQEYPAKLVEAEAQQTLATLLSERDNKAVDEYISANEDNYTGEGTLRDLADEMRKES